MEWLGAASRDPARLNALFAALADPTRRAILMRLASGEASVNELAEPFRVTQPAISKHLRVLERVGLISGTQDAQRRPRRLEAIALAEVEQWLEPFRKLWQARYAELDTVLAELGARDRKRERRTGKGRKKNK